MFKYLHLIGIHQEFNTIVFIKTYVVDVAIYANKELLMDLDQIISESVKDEWSVKRLLDQFKVCGHITIDQIKFQLVDSTNTKS